MTLFSRKVLSVAVPRPVHGLFTYLVPDHLAEKIKVGGLVKVPFARSVTHAFAVDLPQPLENIPSGLSPQSLKEILEVDDSEAVFPADVLALCRWAHQYYFAPLGEVLHCASYSVMNFSKKLKGKPREIKGPKAIEQRVDLTVDQQSVLETLELLRKSAESKVALLQGVTGSGKTEVYIELARRTLDEGRGVIVLVPEIALTPQLHLRFERSLGQPVALWHSALADGKRRDLSIAVRTGKIRIVIGARSAVFAPISQLGLLVIDEEHEPTYKQEDRVRYHARDLAIVRGKLTQSLIVLGSATPSFETLERVSEGRYKKVELTKRIAAGGIPQVQIVDLREELLVQDTQAVLSNSSLKALQEVIDSGEQAIIYLNRRGFASFLICQDCGKVKTCPRCSISLTLHKGRLRLQCHVCSHEERIPDRCPGCQGSKLKAMGAGVESLELELPRFLKGARISRLDRDQITSAKRLAKTLDEFRNLETNLLVGTQMLVKGHDFPGVTLVLVVLADSLFRWPDFRAPERAYQILKQVAGRAGRGDKPGKVLIQTYDPDHTVLQTLDGRLPEEVFIKQESELRQVLSYPPFFRLARIRFESSSRQSVIERAKTVALALGQTFSNEVGRSPPRGLEILGPSEAFLEKAKDAYRWDILIKCNNIQLLHKVVNYARSLCLQQKWHFLVDIDPYGV